MAGQRIVVVAFAVFLAGLCVLSGLNAAPVECNNGDGTQISENGYQSQTQTGPGCQSQTSEDGSQSQSQSQSGGGYQSQTQCSGSSCGQFSPLPPLFTLKPFEPFEPMQPLTFQPFGPVRSSQVQQRTNYD
ncbi:uncharacterized protein [Drosophila takahashii]|uniref:uncharacterized protein n=1 Tax=Drosophila takahashii TaxID=29030 RepID=UPI001CF8991B|nr:uncharacterized protein LOC108066223 [Drosophila takahashii]